MNTGEFDARLYTNLPTFSIQSAVTIAQALIDAAPPGLPAPALKAKRSLQRAVNAAKAALARRQKGTNTPPGDGTAIDHEADASWSALRLRLQGYAVLPQPANPRVKRAKELLLVLFGEEGLEFVNFGYPEQLTAMTTLLDRITEEELGRDLEMLAGAEFLAQVRAVNPRYDAMVKEMLARDEQNENLLQHLRAIARAMQWYVNAVTGNVDPDDDESVAACHGALAALRNYRAMQANRAAGAKKDEKTEESTPTG